MIHTLSELHRRPELISGGAQEGNLREHPHFCEPQRCGISKVDNDGAEDE